MTHRRKEKIKTTRCCGRVFDGWHSHPCGNKASVEREGKFYCKVHDPVRIEEKAKIRDKEVEERRIERNRWIVLGHPDYRVMEKALELACEDISEVIGSVPANKKKSYMDEARKMLAEEK